MLGKLALPAIRELIELGDETTLREALNRWLPPTWPSWLLLCRGKTGHRCCG